MTEEPLANPHVRVTSNNDIINTDNTQLLVCIKTTWTYDTRKIILTNQYTKHVHPLVHGYYQTLNKPTTI